MLIGFALYAAGLVLALAPVSSAVAGDNADADLSPSVPAQALGRWQVTGDLGTARYGHTATLLANGQVLVAGGFTLPGGYLASAELYDPATGMWTATDNLATERGGHTATLLPNGQVLAAGGVSVGSAQHDHHIPRAELYRSSKRKLDAHRQPSTRALSSYSDVAAQWQGTCLRRIL